VDIVRVERREVLTTSAIRRMAGEANEFAIEAIEWQRNEVRR
jgi:hypothetical protein